MNTTIKELSALSAACQDLLSGKYILIDIKINAIVKEIDNNVKLNDIVSECVNSFSFKDLFSAATANGNFHALDGKQMIALTYGILYRIKNKEISFSELLSNHFTDENFNNQISKFVNNVITPFLSALQDVFVKRHVIVESDEYQNNYYNKIKTTTKLILSEINNFKLGDNDKDEFSMLLNALYLASDKNDKNLVYTLMVALDYFTKYHKKVRKTYLALEECFA